MTDRLLEYVVQHLGGHAPYLLPSTHPKGPLEECPPTLCPNIQHVSHGQCMTLQQWVDHMETEHTLTLPDLHAPSSWVFRTPEHVYCQDVQTGHVQKFGRLTRLTLSGGIVNAPSLLWLPQFNEACRRSSGTTLVICESAALSTLWREKCGAHSFGTVSRGSRRAGDGLVGIEPCPEMPGLVVATLATVAQQLIQHAKSAMRTCRFDRIVLHMMRAAQPDPDIVEAIHQLWPHSRRWYLCMATLKPCHLSACFKFLQLRHSDIRPANEPGGTAPFEARGQGCAPEETAHAVSDIDAELPASLELASPACLKRLFKMACWNALDGCVPPPKKLIRLSWVEIQPSETERMLLTHNRQCEANTKFYSNPHRLYMGDHMERFQCTHRLTHAALRQHYGPGNFEDGLRRLLSESRLGADLICAVCLDPIPKCATLVLPCCHTLCTMCYFGIVGTRCTAVRCPLCQRELDEDQEPLLWVRAKSDGDKNSKLKWAPACDNMLNIGGPHNGSLALTSTIALWDTRPNTLHRAALAVVSSMDAGHDVMIYALLWLGFDQVHDVVSALMQLLPDTYQIQPDGSHTAWPRQVQDH